MTFSLTGLSWFNTKSDFLEKKQSLKKNLSKNLVISNSHKKSIKSLSNNNSISFKTIPQETKTKNQEHIFKKKILRAIFTPMPKIIKQLPSFRCKGELRLNLYANLYVKDKTGDIVDTEFKKKQLINYAKGGLKPNFPILMGQRSNDKDNNNSNNNYNRIIKKFVFNKDKKGNFFIFQDVETFQKEKLQTQYNGSLYFIDGKYKFIDLNNNTVNNNKLKEKLAYYKQEKFQPMVKQDLFVVLNNIANIVKFEKSKTNHLNKTYSINWLKSDNNVQLEDIKHLYGKLIINNLYNIVTSFEMYYETQVNLENNLKIEADYTFDIKFYDIGKNFIVKESLP